MSILPGQLFIVAEVSEVTGLTGSCIRGRAARLGVKKEPGKMLRLTYEQILAVVDYKPMNHCPKKDPRNMNILRRQLMNDGRKVKKG